MLNRFGLVDFDAEKFLREQDEQQTQDGAGDDGQEQPPQPEEDPDEKIDKAREKNQASDLVDFRKRHATIIYQIANTPDDAENAVERNSSIRSLRHKFETSGVDQPFFVLFDPDTTGLSGPKHLALVAGLHNGGRVSGGRVSFGSAGEASSFAESAQSIRPDLSFEVDDADKTSVRVANSQAQAPAAPQSPQ